MNWQLSLLLVVAVGGIWYLARKSGIKRQQLRQREADASARESDAKIDASPPRHGDDLRNAWNDKLRRKE